MIPPSSIAAMSRRQILLTAAALAAALPLSATRAMGAPRRCFVDSVTGDDAQDGSAPASAVRTLRRALALGGDWFGLARNSVFREPLLLTSSAMVEAYGAGERPQIDAARALHPDRWQRVEDGIWQYGDALPYIEGMRFDGIAGAKAAEFGPNAPDRSWHWAERRLRVRSAENPGTRYTSIATIDSSCITLKGADGFVIRGIAAVNGVHGILGQHARGVLIEDCFARHCTFNGFYLADQVADWNLQGCVAEENSGAGFAFNYGAERSTIRASRGVNNGIDGCQFSEGCGTGNLLVDCVFAGNAVAGVNCKEKRQSILRCAIRDNGEAGIIAQQNTELLEISDSVIARNNASDNGTMNLALEDGATVRSARNLYIGPRAGAKVAVNVRLIGRSSYFSFADCYADTTPGNNVAASVRVASEEPIRLSLIHCSFYNTSSSAGRVVDCRGATRLVLDIANTAIVGPGACVAYEPSIRLTMHHNCYFNTAGGPLIDATGVDRIASPGDLARFRASTGRDQASIAADPRFVDPARFDFSLSPGSPARGAGLALEGAADIANVPFGSRPNIGAVAAAGDLKARTKT